MPFPKIRLRPLEIDVPIMLKRIWIYLNVGTYSETGDKRVAVNITDMYSDSKGLEYEKILRESPTIER